MSVTTVPMGEIVTILGGGTPDRAKPEYWGGNIPWASVKDMTSLSLERTTEMITAEGAANSATNIISKGQIIVSTRMAVGKAAINAVDVAINQDLKALKPSKGWDARFLLWFILSKADYLEKRGKGATVKGITLDVLRELEVPNHPFDEQRRIAAILDKADSIRRKSKHALVLADGFLRSEFLELFGDPVSNPLGWPTAPLSSLIDPARPITYGILMPGPDVPDGVPYVRVVDMSDGAIKLEQVRKTTASIANEYRRSRLQPTDLLISIRGHVGRLAIVPDSLDGANITQDTARLAVAEDQMCPHYLLRCLEAKSMQAYIHRFVRGAAVKGLNLGDLRQLPIPLPPTDLQARFARLSAIHLAKKGKLKQSVGDAHQLFASLSQRAFRGEM